jgi:glycosyltransferase involved in cell wall biosynthesis
LLEYATAFIAELYLILKLFARTRFGILQACNPPDVSFLIALLLKPFGVRFIFDHHDLSPELFEAKFEKSSGLLYRLTRLAEFCTFKTADACIATNESFKEIAITRGRKRPDKVFVVRNCPDLASLGASVRPSEKKESGPLTVVYVGFMGKQDGLDLLLKAADHIINKEQRRDVRFVLVGRGSELPEMKAWAEAQGLSAWMTFTGQVSYSEVGAYLTQADIGVAPDPKTAMNDRSTMIKILEYMAFGLPVVLFDLKEGRRIAGSSALYAFPNDPVDFAEKISTLLNSSEMRRELGNFGRRRIEERLNWDAEKIALLEAYNFAAGSMTRADEQPAVDWATRE